MQTHETVMEEIKPIVAEILAVELEEVHPQARFFEDLGGESIDMLELAFQLEKRYRVPMPIQKVAAAEDLMTDEAGRLTDASLALLRSQYPFLDYARIEANPTKARLTETVTIQALAGFVLMMLGKADDPGMTQLT